MALGGHKAGPEPDVVVLAGLGVLSPNHTQVLLCIARDPNVRLKTIAESVGITERAAQRIVHDLIENGLVQRERVGRRNRYVINRELRMRHQAQHEHEIGELLDVLKLDTL